MKFRIYSAPKIQILELLGHQNTKNFNILSKISKLQTLESQFNKLLYNIGYF